MCEKNFKENKTSKTSVVQVARGYPRSTSLQPAISSKKAFYSKQLKKAPLLEVIVQDTSLQHDETKKGTF
jgi:hypothetical protein